MLMVVLLNPILTRPEYICQKLVLSEIIIPVGNELAYYSLWAVAYSYTCTVSSQDAN